MMYRIISIVIGIICIGSILVVEGHPAVTFNATITDENGNIPAPQVTAGIRTRVYFTFQDMLTNYETINFANLEMHHGRWVHLLIVSFDWQIAAHLHPDDFKVMTVNNTQTVFYVELSFPKAGKYSFSYSFIYKDHARNTLREGVALLDFAVTGTPVMDPATTTFNYTSSNSFRTYPVNDSDIFDDWVDSATDLDTSSSAYKGVFRVDGQTAESAGGIPADLGVNVKVVQGKCTSIYLDLYDSEGNPAQLVPYLIAAAHFTVSNRDNAVYHAHGMYRPTGYSMPDVVTALNGMSMMDLHDLDMLTNPLYNISMNALMVGVNTNGTVNCASDAGAVMKTMEGMMDMSIFYGPETFSSVMGIFNFPDIGHFDVWAYVKVKEGNSYRLIVPHFPVFSVAEDTSTATTGDDEDSQMGGASSLATLSLLALVFFAMF